MEIRKINLQWETCPSPDSYQTSFQPEDEFPVKLKIFLIFLTYLVVDVQYHGINDH